MSLADRVRIDKKMQELQEKKRREMQKAMERHK